MLVGFAHSTVASREPRQHEHRHQPRIPWIFPDRRADHRFSGLTGGEGDGLREAQGRGMPPRPRHLSLGSQNRKCWDQDAAGAA